MGASAEKMIPELPPGSCHVAPGDEDKDEDSWQGSASDLGEGDRRCYGWGAAITTEYYPRDEGGDGQGIFFCEGAVWMT